MHQNVSMNAFYSCCFFFYFVQFNVKTKTNLTALNLNVINIIINECVGYIVVALDLCMD